MEPLCKDRLERLRRIGDEGYVEIVLRRVFDSGQASDFLVLARGYLKSDGSKRGTKFLTIPASLDHVRWLREALEEVEQLLATSPNGQ